VKWYAILLDKDFSGTIEHCASGLTLYMYNVDEFLIELLFLGETHQFVISLVAKYHRSTCFIKVLKHSSLECFSGSSRTICQSGPSNVTTTRKKKRRVFLENIFEIELNVSYQVQSFKLSSTHWIWKQKVRARSLPQSPWFQHCNC